MSSSSVAASDLAARHPLQDTPVLYFSAPTTSTQPTATINLFNAALYVAACCRLADVEPFGPEAATAPAALAGAPMSVADLVDRHQRTITTPPPQQQQQPSQQKPCASVVEGCSDQTTLVEGSRLLGLATSTSSPRFVYTSHHYPGGIYRLVESLSYPTNQGLKTLTRAAVDDQLRLAQRPYVTDLLPDRYVATAEQLTGVSCTVLDEARFALVAMCDVVAVRKMFNADGSLTGLAKRDLKKNCRPAPVASAAATSEPLPPATTHQHGSSRHGNVVTAPPSVRVGLAESASATGVSADRNTKGILIERCVALWPYIPADNALSMTFETDPAAPRHKPRFRATVVVTGLAKAKQSAFVGEWCGTKRDAETTACSAALVTLSRHKP